MKKRKISEKAWIRRVLERYGEIEKLQPKQFELEIEESPKWVIKLWPILLGVSHPGLDVLRSKKWISRDLGKFLGRQSALEGIIWDEVPLSPRVEQEKEKWITHQYERAKNNPKMIKEAFSVGRKLEKWRPHFQKFIAETLVEARSRPYAEASSFLEAFGKANVIAPDDLATEKTIGVGEKIAYVMITFWRPISKFQSIAELHSFLQTAAKPFGIVITLKRVEKLCQRIGLKFKNRGRPKKKNIQTNSPRAS